MIRIVELEDGRFRLEIRIEVDGFVAYHETTQFEKVEIDDTPEKSGGYKMELRIATAE